MTVIASALALVALLGACSSGGTDGAAKSPTPGITGPKVDVADFDFKPKTISIKAGETITWVLVGASQHDVTADKGEFKSGTKSKGETFTHTFAAAGEFKYTCTIHPAMTATVTVTA